MRKAIGHLVRHIAAHGLLRGTRLVWLKSRKAPRPVRVSSPLTGGDLCVRPGTSDMAIYDQIALNPYIPIDQPLDTVIDLGANIGITVRYWKAHWPAARVVAVEPDPDNHALLVRNTAHLKHVYCVQAGAWHTEGHLFLERDGLASSSFRTRRSEGDGGIPAVTVPGLMSKYGMDRISLLKVDIEGSERELFSAADLSWIERVDAIAIELHDHWRPGCGDAFFRAVTLHSWSYSVHGEMILCIRREGDRT